MIKIRDWGIDLENNIVNPLFKCPHGKLFVIDKLLIEKRLFNKFSEGDDAANYLYDVFNDNEVLKDNYYYVEYHMVSNSYYQVHRDVNRPDIDNVFLSDQSRLNDNFNYFIISSKDFGTLDASAMSFIELFNRSLFLNIYKLKEI